MSVDPTPDPTPDPEKRTNDEIYDLMVDRAGKMLDEADTLVREANTLHRFCEMLVRGNFHPVEIRTLFSEDEHKRVEWPS
jgi:hypothetical protein